MHILGPAAAALVANAACSIRIPLGFPVDTLVEQMYEASVRWLAGLLHPRAASSDQYRWILLTQATASSNERARSDFVADATMMIASTSRVMSRRRLRRYDGSSRTKAITQSMATMADFEFSKINGITAPDLVPRQNN